MDYWEGLKLNDVVPISDGLSNAISLLAPHAGHTTEATVIALGRRSPVLSIAGLVAVKVHGTHNESDNLRYVLDHTVLPAPKLFGLWQDHEGTNFLIMEQIKGEPANKVWSSLTSAQKQCITERLKLCFEELRTNSAGYIGAPGFRPLSSDFLDFPYYGPFRQEDELHDAMIKSIKRKPNYNATFARQMLKGGHRVVLTHGDFSLKNFMIHQGELSGIIDWEYAGFYPDYWEYAVAFSCCDWTVPELSDWGECIQRFLKPFPVEAAALKTLLDYTICGM